MLTFNQRSSLMNATIVTNRQPAVKPSTLHIVKGPQRGRPKRPSATASAAAAAAAAAPNRRHQARAEDARNARKQVRFIRSSVTNDALSFPVVQLFVLIHFGIYYYLYLIPSFTLAIKHDQIHSQLMKSRFFFLSIFNQPSSGILFFSSKENFPSFSILY